MAQRTQVVLIDDLDGTELEDGGTVSFSHMGVDYEIDLSDENALKLEPDSGQVFGGWRCRCSGCSSSSATAYTPSSVDERGQCVAVGA